MRMRAAFFGAVVLTLCVAAMAQASETRSVPVVTQVQGTVLFRTSITINNGNESITTPVVMRFSYRSPVDNTFQIATLTLSPALGPKRVRFFDDIVQEFKNAGAIRAADMNQGLFGTLLVTFEALDIRREAGAVARTYSPAPGGGTLGFAYPGLCYCASGTTDRALGAARDGSFGNDGSTRANLGIINQGDNTGTGSTDVAIFLSDGETGAQLKSFLLSSVIGRELAANEVYQLNNIFNDPLIPASVTRLSVKVQAVRTGFFVSAYVVQLDNTTQDGSFFLLFEE